MNALKERILNDLIKIGIDTKGFELVLRPFSKSYYGRYLPKTQKVFVYVYADKELNNLYPYNQLFRTVLHEVVHHIQWSDPEYVRIKGVMHNTEFYRLYNKLLRKHERKMSSNVIKIADTSQIAC